MVIGKLYLSVFQNCATLTGTFFTSSARSTRSTAIAAAVEKVQRKLGDEAKARKPMLAESHQRRKNARQGLGLPDGHLWKRQLAGLHLSNPWSFNHSETTAETCVMFVSDIE